MLPKLPNAPPVLAPKVLPVLGASAPNGALAAPDEPKLNPEPGSAQRVKQSTFDFGLTHLK